MDPVSNNQRTGTARSKSAESTRRPDNRAEQSFGAVQVELNQLGQNFQVHSSTMPHAGWCFRHDYCYALLVYKCICPSAHICLIANRRANTQHTKVLTTEVYRLAKQRNREKVETLAAQLHAKARVVDTLVDDHRRINQDLQDIQGALDVSRQEHQNVARNLDAIVNHVNTKMSALGDAIAAGVGGAGGGGDGGSGGAVTAASSNVASAAAAADAAAARDLLNQLVQAQQEQARGTAVVAQREARKSAILFSAVVQMGELLDGLRSEVRCAMQSC